MDANTTVIYNKSVWPIFVCGWFGMFPDFEVRAFILIKYSGFGKLWSSKYFMSAFVDLFGDKCTYMYRRLFINLKKTRYLKWSIPWKRFSPDRISSGKVNGSGSENLILCTCFDVGDKHLPNACNFGDSFIAILFWFDNSRMFLSMANCKLNGENIMWMFHQLKKNESL